jgi:hypothetical protein
MVLKYECQHCRDEMTFIYNNRNKYCNKPECQRALVKINIEQKKSIHKAHHKILLDLHETHIEDLEGLESGHHIPLKLLGSIEQNKPITALLPDNTNRVTRLPEERKEGFLSHLRALFNGIKTGEKNSFPIYADELEAPLSSAVSSLLGNACATCKGYCCTGGGAHHAFQDYPSLQQYLSAQPEDITEDDLVEAYRHYIPTESYRNSCVFQGHHGCTLPSDMRSFTCNNYRCSSLTTYQQDLAKSTSELTYAAAFDGDTITRTNIFDTQDFVPLLIVH